jgi:dihydroorotase
MSHLFKNVKVVQPGSDLNGKTIDIHVSNGIIEKIGSDISIENATVFEREGLCVSSGWVDLLSNFMDPGYEYKENLTSGLNAAASGGFTAVAVMPDTEPVIDSAAQVNDLLRRSEQHQVFLLPVGSISKRLKQDSLAELFDMSSNGAVAFCDAKKHLANSDLMRIALQYAKGAGLNVWSFPKDASIAGVGYMNEGLTSTLSGIKGVPSLAEELAVARDIQLSEYTGCPVHFPMISCKGSVDLVAKALASGVKVSAGAASYHLKYTDEDLIDLDSNLKTDHPLRSKKDKEALIAAISDGIVTSIVSDHTPQDYEAKVLEFGHAEYGMINLQTSFAMSRSSSLGLDSIIASFTNGPREILGQVIPSLMEAERAELTFFCPDETWTFTKELNQSLSNNSPVLGVELVGRPIAIASAGKVTFGAGTCE